jgi:hypothetical protein
VFVMNLSLCYVCRQGLGVPLPAAKVEMLEENLTWNKIQVGAITYIMLLLLSSTLLEPRTCYSRRCCGQDPWRTCS